MGVVGVVLKTRLNGDNFGDVRTVGVLLKTRLKGGNFGDIRTVDVVLSSAPAWETLVVDKRPMQYLKVP